MLEAPELPNQNKEPVAADKTKHSTKNKGSKSKIRKNFQEWLDLIFTTPLKIIILVILVYLFYRVVYLNVSDKYYIEEVKVPKRLVDMGLDGTHVQEAILENIDAILSSSQYANDKTGLNFAPENKDDFKIEYEGFSFDNLINKLIFFKKSIKTDIYTNLSGDLSLRYVIDKNLPNYIYREDALSDDQEMELLSYQAAEDIVNDISPMTIAYFHYQQGDYVGAIDKVDDIIKNSKNRNDVTKALSLKGQMFLDQNRPDDAVNWLVKGIKYNPNDFDLHIALAFGYMNTADFKRSWNQIAAARKIVDDDKSNQATLCNAEGSYYALKQNNVLAFNYYKKGIKLDSVNASLWTNTGMIYANIMQYDSAEVYFDHIYKKDYSRMFKDDEANKAIGLVNTDNMQAKLRDASVAHTYKYGLYALSLSLPKPQFKNAESLLLKCLELDPTFAPASYKLGCIYHDEKKYDQSRLMFENAKKEVPFSPEIYNGIISDCLEQGDYYEAKRRCDTILDADPNPMNCQDYVMLGNAYSRESKTLQQAGYFYLLALAINPRDKVALDSYCDFKMSQADYHAALSLCNRILAIEPNNTKAITNRSLIKAKLGL